MERMHFDCNLVYKSQYIHSFKPSSPTRSNTLMKKKYHNGELAVPSNDSALKKHVSNLN